jgi:tetratricopeptide (TPR) repeat protein
MDARRMLTSILLRAGKLEDARVELTAMLNEDKVNAGQIFIHLYQVMSIFPDKAASFKLIGDLAQPYPQLPEAHLAVAQLAQLAGEENLALSEVKLAENLRPDWNMAVSLEASLLQKSEPQAGLDRLKRFLVKNPDDREIRIQYARALLDQKQFQLSRDEFRYLSSSSPDSSEMAFAIAMISLQMQDYQEAEAQLQLALSKGKKDKDTVRYYLGQLNEAQAKFAEAITNYKLVDAGEYQFAAQLRIAYLLNKQGDIASSIQQLHQVQPSSNQQRAQLIMVESRFLMLDKRMTEAFSLLQQGLAMLPSNPDLLYETALTAEKIGQSVESEKLLRKLIKVRPDDAHAYNALGFSLIERNERLPEAIILVEKALQLAPEDSAILDSVGWGYYRSGRLVEGIQILRRALANNPDPEIAAHLGEVLWAHGDKDEASKVWQASLKDNPDNSQLKSVILKFIP